MADWYEEYIEPEIRQVVCLLRNNGVNTESSCGHEMTVQCQYITDGFVRHVDNLLFNNGHRNYTITLELNRLEGHLYPTMEIAFKRKGWSPATAAGEKMKMIQRLCGAVGVGLLA